MFNILPFGYIEPQNNGTLRLPADYCANVHQVSATNISATLQLCGLKHACVTPKSVPSSTNYISYIS